MFASAIIAAGGRGERLGGDRPKQLQDVGGRTILQRSVEPFDCCLLVREIIVVLPTALASHPPAWLSTVATATRVVAGGPRRQDSVAAGLQAISPDAEFVVVHDAARPFCTTRLIERTIEAAAESGAAIAALAAHDTLKRSRRQDGQDFVAESTSRAGLFHAQTPQAFSRSVLESAVARNEFGRAGTDEATLVERTGHPVRLVPGDPRNMKITTEADLAFARQLTAQEVHGVPTTRIGLGYDLHRLVDGRRLVLAGVEIPGDRGLDGHSDADVVCHAVTDAVLGASNQGDIGRLFPDDDARWKGASSIDLLRRAMTTVGDHGFVVVNVDVVVITDWPKIRDHSVEMRQCLADALGIGVDRVGIKGKTSEGVGPIGRGEAIAVHAIALVAQPAGPVR